ncbi:MAG: hypothetical protein M1814_001179 [Vezdaea aestivalis]|nr:MAG: hypothetical protein M1814_001179 [Vezdaea aestivalis]
MSFKPKILFVLTSHDKIDKIGKQTGWYLPEFAHPYHTLSDKVDIVVASPAGGKAPLDQGSIEASKSDSVSTDFLNTQSALWEDTRKLAEFTGRSKEFAAIFYVGGHGPMYDLVSDPISISLIEEFWNAGKIVSAICHGPCVFLKTKTADGTPLVNGSEVTGFSNSEEDASQLSAAMPFMLEDELKKLGATYLKADADWGEKVCVAKGGRLITGQNPASGGALGKALWQNIQAAA